MSKPHAARKPERLLVTTDESARETLVRISDDLRIEHTSIRKTAILLALSCACARAFCPRAWHAAVRQ